MPDNTNVRATTPAGEHIKLENWPLADDAGATVRVAVAQTQLQHCATGAAGLEDGAARLLRRLDALLEPKCHRGPPRTRAYGLRPEPWSLSEQPASDKTSAQIPAPAAEIQDTQPPRAPLGRQQR